MDLTPHSYDAVSSNDESSCTMHQKDTTRLINWDWGGGVLVKSAYTRGSNCLVCKLIPCGDREMLN